MIIYPRFELNDGLANAFQVVPRSEDLCKKQLSRAGTSDYTP